MSDVFTDFSLLSFSIFYSFFFFVSFLSFFALFILSLFFSNHCSLYIFTCNHAPFHHLFSSFIHLHLSCPSFRSFLPSSISVFISLSLFLFVFLFLSLCLFLLSFLLFTSIFHIIHLLIILPPKSSSPPPPLFSCLFPPSSFSLHLVFLSFLHLCPLLFPSSSSLLSIAALAASSGQLSISSLDGGAGHILLGGPGGPAVPPSLRPSLFLNRPTLLPMVTGSIATASTPAMGLVSSGVGCGPRPSFSQSPLAGTSNLMSPTSCPEESASPCSSPASFCSFSEASPPPLGGAMAE